MKKLYIIFLYAIIFVSLTIIPAVARNKFKTEPPILNENSASLQSGKGFLAELKGDYKSAIEYFSNAIELNPQDAISYHERGLCYYYLNNYPNALKDFDKTISLNPSDIDAFGNRSLTKMQLGDYEGAIKDIDEILKLYPDYPKALKQKEMILEKMKNK